MFRFKLSWILAVVTFLIWSVVIFKLSAFAAGEQPVKFVWTSQAQPISGTPAVIEMKPSMLAPKGMPPAPMRSLLTRVLGKSLGGLIPSAGIVYQVMDLEGRRQTVAYAIDQLMKNGQPVTPQTIQEWIAAQNNIDTSPSSYNYYQGADTTIENQNTASYWIGKKIYIPPYLFTLNENVHMNGHYANYPTYSSHGVYGYVVYIATGGLMPNSSQYYGGAFAATREHIEDPNTLGPKISGGFDPADYPEIFGPDFFPSQAIDALVAQGLDSFDIVLNNVTPEPGNHDEVIVLHEHGIVPVEATYPTPETEWTEVYASNGQTYRIPIGALGGSVVPQYQPPSNSVDVQTDTGQKTLSNDESKPFIDAGVPQGAKIVRVDPKTGTVTYVDPATGQAKTVQVPKTAAVNLTNNHRVFNTVTNSSETTNIHQEIKLPEVHVSGEINVSSGSLEPVSQDRVEASRTRFQTSWNNLKQTFADMFTVNLTGIGRLPVWNWPMLGHVIVIDFNVYAEELNWLGLAFLFFATISAIFIVINH